jgi:hypothetical protein
VHDKSTPLAAGTSMGTIFANKAHAWFLQLDGTRKNDRRLVFFPQKCVGIFPLNHLFCKTFFGVLDWTFKKIPLLRNAQKRGENI